MHCNRKICLCSTKLKKVKNLSKNVFLYSKNIDCIEKLLREKIINFRSFYIMTKNRLFLLLKGRKSITIDRHPSILTFNIIRLLCIILQERCFSEKNSQVLHFIINFLYAINNIIGIKHIITEYCFLSIFS